MTDKLSERLEALAEKATQGPWEVVQFCKADGSKPIDTVKLQPAQPRVLGSFDRPDGELLVELVNNLPAIIKALKANDL